MSEIPMTEEEEQRLLAEIAKYAREREPWKQAGNIWRNDKAYFTYLRGAYRKLWSRYPVRVEFKNKARYRQQIMDANGAPVRNKGGKNKGKIKERWAIDCEICKESKPQNDIQIDHMIPSGSCRNNLEGAVFFYKLLCDAQHMRAVCIPCHEEITYAEKHNLTIDQAARQKSAIAWLKDRTPAQQKEDLMEVGFTKDEIKNATQRRECYVKYLEDLVS